MFFATSAVFFIYQLIRYRTRSVHWENQRIELQIKKGAPSMRLTMAELQKSKNEMTAT
jgi:hypothetical protein